MNKADIARKVISETGLKSKRAIAIHLVENYPDTFSSIESARTIVRYVTGSHGENKRREISNPEKVKFFYNGFETWAKENLNEEQRPWDEPFVIPSSIKTLNVIADIHSVHLCHKTMSSFIRNTKDKTAVLLNGDLLDSEALSRHLKTHNVVEYEKELEICHNILKGLKEEFTHVYFKHGNHDYWLMRYLLINAREIFRLRGLELGELLRLGELGVHEIHNLKYIQYGDLDIIHGHEFPGFGGGKFPATTLVDRWQTFKHRYDVKIMASHSHRQDHNISKRSKDGLYGEGWVTPAMCRKSASYNPYAGWDNGWAVVNLIEGKAEIDLILNG